MSALVQSESFFTHKEEYFTLVNALVADEDEVAAKAHVKAIGEIVRVGCVAARRPPPPSTTMLSPSCGVDEHVRCPTVG